MAGDESKSDDGFAQPSSNSAQTPPTVERSKAERLAIATATMGLLGALVAFGKVVVESIQAGDSATNVQARPRVTHDLSQAGPFAADAGQAQQCPECRQTARLAKEPMITSDPPPRALASKQKSTVAPPPGAPDQGFRRRWRVKSVDSEHNILTLAGYRLSGGRELVRAVPALPAGITCYVTVFPACQLSAAAVKNLERREVRVEDCFRLK